MARCYCNGNKKNGNACIVAVNWSYLHVSSLKLLVFSTGTRICYYLLVLFMLLVFSMCCNARFRFKQRGVDRAGYI